MKIAFILGTRPEIIKMSPLIKLCEAEQIDYFLVHSGQHFSYKMTEVFFQQLGLKPPQYNVETSKILHKGIVEKKSHKEVFENPDGCLHHGKQLGLILGKTEEILFKENPDFVLVQGDTNTTLAGALAAVKLQHKIGHVEAGLRSYDPRMPEEINRILTDRISDFLFCPTTNQRDILLSEGIEKDKIFVTGNTIVDVVFSYQKKIEVLADKVLAKLNLDPDKYFLLTTHREENVEDFQHLFEILDSIDRVAKHLGIPTVFPVHPRTEQKIQEKIDTSQLQIRLIKPLGFFEFISLEKKARLVFTDSGGIQEESCILKTPCITLRSTTERPETLQVNANRLSGPRYDELLENVRAMMKREKNWPNPFGKGDTAQKILSVLKSKRNRPS
ncbi:MAG: UDP-N-acetylglucosamine 2-epimerase (non-hydrolyzing) [Candidatus Aminicenantes bacterium]|jgi:UDP-N-acetylglucosamine 2-epimerase (non-hydrolysing)